MNDMQKRFHALTAEAARIRGLSAPSRDERDKLQADIAAIDAKIKPLTAQIKEIEKPLYDIEQERAALARALGGKTGAPA